MARIKFYNKKTGQWEYADRSGDSSNSSQMVDIPKTLPNPNPITFTGAVEATYDGSEAVSVEIPSGGIPVTGATVGQTVQIAEVDKNGVPTAWLPVDMPSGGSVENEYRLINTVEITETVSEILFDADSEGKPLDLREYFLVIDNTPSIEAATNVYIRHNGLATYSVTRYELFPTTANANNNVKNWVHGVRYGAVWNFLIRYNKGDFISNAPVEFNANVNSIHIFGANFVSGRLRLYGRLEV